MEEMDQFTDILKTEGIMAKGYGIVPKIVMQDRRLSTTAKAIYAYMCSFAGAGSIAFPSLKKMAADLGVGKTETLIKHRRQLEQCGYIKVEQKREHGKFAKNIYILVQNPESIDIHTNTPIPDSRESVKKGIPQKGNPLNGDININSFLKSNNKDDDVDDATPKIPNTGGSKVESIDVNEVRKACSIFGVEEEQKEILVQALLEEAVAAGRTLEDIKNTIQVMDQAEEEIFNAQGFIRWAMKKRAKAGIKIPGRFMEKKTKDQLQADELERKYRDIYMN